MLKALPLGADRARIRATMAERIMFLGVFLAFAIEIMSEEGLVSSTAEKDREKQGIISNGDGS